MSPQCVIVSGQLRETNLKKCIACKATRPLSEYYKHKQMADVHLNKCKDCCKSQERERRAGPSGERIRAYDRARGSRQTAEYRKSYRAKSPNKYKAQTKVSNAKRDGKILRAPCEVCGEQNTHAHHDDYLKPLEIRWLCPLHHSRWHAENGEAKNP